MAFRTFRFVPYAAADAVPNVVVDGSPNASTVLTLSHWPRIHQPEGLAADLSAEMAFRYLRAPCDHAPADVVTNNHFDQDGLVSVYALAAPEDALRREELLVDLAAAGDFATYRHRVAARASMTIAAYTDPERSPIAGELTGSHDEQTAVLYERTLAQLVPIVTDPGRFRELWAEEDEDLTTSEAALADGRITIHEIPDVDLAVVTVAADEPVRAGHRFGSHAFEGVHPMALHNATSCFRLLVVHGRRYRYVDRYETWVQYRSRAALPRVDLAPLAEQLDAIEAGRTVWRADPPSTLTPLLTHEAESSIDPAVLRSVVVEHLRSSPAAWDPTVAARV